MLGRSAKGLRQRGSLPAAVHQQFSLQRGKDCNHAHTDVCRHLLLEVPRRERAHFADKKPWLVGRLGKSLLTNHYDEMGQVFNQQVKLLRSLEQILTALKKIHMN